MKNLFLQKSFLQNLFLMGLILLTQIIKSGPYCWDYQETRSLRKGPFTPVTDCPCNCAQQYQTTDFDKRGRKCTRCDHKQVFSSDPFQEAKKAKEKELLRLKMNALVQELEGFGQQLKAIKK